MTEREFADLLEEALIESNEDGDITIRSYESAGVLTYNEGLVVRIDDTEFQVTIVRSS
jgi:hypothetical protein